MPSKVTSHKIASAAAVLACNARPNTKSAATALWAISSVPLQDSGSPIAILEFAPPVEPSTLTLHLPRVHTLTDSPAASAAFPSFAMVPSTQIPLASPPVTTPATNRVPSVVGSTLGESSPVAAATAITGAPITIASSAIAFITNAAESTFPS